MHVKKTFGLAIGGAALLVFHLSRLGAAADASFGLPHNLHEGFVQGDRFFSLLRFHAEDLVHVGRKGFAGFLYLFLQEFGVRIFYGG